MRKPKAESSSGWRSGVLLGALLLVSGCNGTGVQPVANAAGTPPPAAVAAESAAPANAVAGTGAQAPAPADVAGLRNQLDQLSGRLVLLQEQVIQLKALGQQQADTGQAVLQRLQRLTSSGAAGATDEAPLNDEMGGGAQQLDAALAQLMQMMNGIQGGGEPYAIASAYTAKGEWILLRYDTQSGDSWLADGGRWMALSEDEGLPSARYQVQMLRADQDLKGYVAVRIDQLSGKSWWLNDRRWQVYQ